MRSLAPLRIGYFADGIWAHNAFRKLIADKNFHICFITPRFDSTDSTLRDFATKHSIPYIKAHDINAPSFLESIAHFKCDIFVSMSFNQIFREPLLSFPRLKTINCHAGKLPAYRGRNILNWALINDEREFGISVHYVDSGIDTGDIILQRSYPITDEDDYTSLLTRAHTECAQILYDALGLLHRGEARPYPQAKEGGFYCPARVKGDEWIDWHSSSRDIFNFIRALNAPDLGARAMLGGEEIIIYRAEMIEGAVEYKATPGAIVGIESLEDSDLLEGHSALPPLNSSLGNHLHNPLISLHCGARPSAPHSQGFSVVQSNTANTRIVCGEIQDSKEVSESTSPVIASEAKQSTESNPHANLEFNTDSEPTPAVGHSSTAIESSFSSERSAEQALKASSGWGIVKGEGATSQFKPLPLNKKENTESEEVKKTLEVKIADSKAIDSESKNKAVSAMVGDSEKWGSQSVDCHEAIASRNDGTRIATDSESTPSVIASNAKQSIKTDSKNLESTIASHPQIPAQARTPHRVAIVKTLDTALRLTHYKASRSLKIGDRLFSLAARGGGAALNFAHSRALLLFAPLFTPPLLPFFTPIFTFFLFAPLLAGLCPLLYARTRLLYALLIPPTRSLYART